MIDCFRSDRIQLSELELLSKLFCLKATAV